ncbi:hypothetical protein OKW20_003737 [Ensifer sp. LBL]
MSEHNAPPALEKHCQTDLKHSLRRPIDPQGKRLIFEFAHICCKRRFSRHLRAQSISAPAAAFHPGLVGPVQNHGPSASTPASPCRPNCYDDTMNTKTARSIRLPLAATLAAAIAVVLLLAFRGWMENGAEMFLALAQSGLSWCL